MLVHLDWMRERSRGPDRGVTEGDNWTSGSAVVEELCEMCVGTATNPQLYMLEDIMNYKTFY